MKLRSRRYVPALGFDVLTPFYDPLVRLTTREHAVKRSLIEAAQLSEGARVLDVGCGTGTLLCLIAAQTQSVSLVGLDGDDRILRTAKSKALKRDLRVCFVQAFSSAAPFRAAVFDRVLSSLMLHHLTRGEKVTALREAFRVLRPGGELHVADWGRPHNLAMTIASLTVRIGDGLGRTADNVRGRIPDLMRDAGFQHVRTTRTFSTPFGTMELFRGTRPDVERDG